MIPMRAYYFVTCLGLLSLAPCVLGIASAQSEAKEQSAGVIDLHVHIAGIGAGGSGAFINEDMREGWRFPIYLRAFGVTRETLELHGDAILLARVNGLIARSTRISKAVVLAMDGVVSKSGALDREATQFYVPNDYLARELPHFEHLLLGASVNPYRPDAIERLRRAKSQGAVLIKWLPNIMGIDPADEAIRGFYEALVELDLPLLTHAGRERAFASAQDELGDPARLELPLEVGVRVIAAHVATDGETRGEANFRRILPLFQRFSNLYADISSLTQLNKLGDLRMVLETPELKSRLVYGSDWPLQFFPLVSPYYYANRLGVARAAEVARIDNQWDRDVALKEALGVPEEVFTRGAEIIGRKLSP